MNTTTSNYGIVVPSAPRPLVVLHGEDKAGDKQSATTARRTTAPRRGVPAMRSEGPAVRPAARRRTGSHRAHEIVLERIPSEPRRQVFAQLQIFLGPGPCGCWRGRRTDDRARCGAGAGAFLEVSFSPRRSGSTDDPASAGRESYRRGAGIAESTFRALESLARLEGCRWLPISSVWR